MPRALSLLALLPLVLTAFFPLPARAADDTHVAIRLIAERGAIKAGETVTIGVEQTLDPHWHTYWINPGDSGTAPRIDWTLPKNFKMADIQWPIPSRLPMGPLVNFGYETKTVLLQDLTAPETLPDGPLTLKADIEILVCNEICIPETHSATLTLNNGAAGHPTAIATARAALPLDMGWESTMKEMDGELVATIHTDNNDAFANTRSVDIFPEEWGLIDNTAPSAASLTEDGLVIHKPRGERHLSEVPVTRAIVTYTDPQGARRGVRVLRQEHDGRRGHPRSRAAPKGADRLRPARQPVRGRDRSWPRAALQ